MNNLFNIFLIQNEPFETGKVITQLNSLLEDLIITMQPFFLMMETFNIIHVFVFDCKWLSVM